MSFDITQLNNSSFRGIPFYTRDDNISGGQRLTDHKFINSGTKTESNGINPKPIKIKAYIGGDNYLDQKEALINAFEDITSGELVDKFNGIHQVYAESWNINEKITAFGKAEIDVTFKIAENNIVEDFDIVFTATVREEAIINFEEEFNNEIGEELTDSIANDIAEFWKSIEDTIKFLEDTRNDLQSLKSKIGGIISKVKTSILSIQSLTSEIQDIWASFDEVIGLDLFGSDDQKSASNLVRNILVDSQSQTFLNAAQEEANKQSKLYISTVIAGLTETNIKNLENIEFETGDDFGSIKDDVLTVYSTLEESISISDTNTIEKIIAKQNLIDKYQVAKREFIEFYTQKYSGLQELKENNLSATIDVMNLTINKYNDIERIDEVLTNNSIVDPFFINGNIKLLDK